MCQPKPGPRCASHARAALEKAEVQYAICRFNNSTTSEVDNAYVTLQQAQQDYDSTRQGRRDLEALIDMTADPELKEHIRQRQAAAVQLHARQKALLSIETSARHSSQQYAASIKRYEEDVQAKHTRLAAINHNFGEAIALSERAKSDCQASTAAVRQYLQSQGEHGLALMPRMWHLEKRSEPGFNKLYQAYQDTKARQKKCLQDVEDMRQERACAQAEYQVSAINYRMAKAEVASGIDPDQPCISHGQTYINPDGTTNARLLRHLPEIDRDVFVKVKKIEGQRMYLETGEVVPMSASIPASSWRFDSPHASAARGPHVFTMESVSR